MLTLLVILLILSFVAGAPLFAVMLFITAVGAATGVKGFEKDFGGFVYEFFSLGTGDKSTIFSSIPLFIYAGYIMAASKTAERLVRFANAALGWVPGGLGIVTILACSVYTTFTGASGVTIVALGGLLMPALIKQRYPERFALGLVTGTGSVGLLFPPALPIILFGTIYGLQRIEPKPEFWTWEWDTERFLLAGIVPGLVLIAMLSALVVTIAVIKKVPRQKFVLDEFFRSIPGALPVIFLPFFILICLLWLHADIAQSASLTVLYLIVVEMGIFRDLKPKMLWAITKESMALVGAIFIIIYSATALTNYLVTAEVPKQLVTWTTEHIHSRWAFLLALNVLLLAAGMVMDIFSAILIVVPLIAPVAHEYDVSPYHLGVIFLLNLEIGYLHPPIGLNLFIASFKFRKPLLEVTVATLPFMLTVLLSLLVVTYVPSLTVVQPPTPRDTLASLVDTVKASAQAVTNVSEVTLPDGTVKKQQDCGAITDQFEQENCLGLFTDVTNCKRKPAAEVEECKAEAAGADLTACRKACEERTIKEWNDEHGTPIDGGSFEDDSDDEGDSGGFEDDADDEGSGEGSEAGSGEGSEAGSEAGSGTGSGTGAGTGSGTGAGTAAGSAAPP